MMLGEEVYSTRDADGPINVYRKGDRLSLCFGNNVEQSGMSLADPALLLFAYTRAMMLGAVLAPEPRHALLLGLGGGSLARTLHTHFPSCRITAVEVRAAVVDTARTWFALPDDDRLGVHLGDAAGYLARCGPEADLLLADLFDGDGMDDQLTDPAFFGLCRQAMSGGVAVFNLWSGRYFSNREINEAIDQAFDGRVLRLPMSGRNRVVFAFADQLPDLSRGALIEQAARLGKRLGFRLEGDAADLWTRHPGLKPG